MAMSSKSARLVFSVSSRQRCRRIPPAVSAPRHYSTPTNRPTSLSTGGDLSRIAQEQQFAEAIAQSQYFPNLMKPDALLDLHDSEEFPASRHSPYKNTVVLRNSPPIFRTAREIEQGKRKEAVVVDEVSSTDDAMRPVKFLHLPPSELQKLSRASIVRVVKQQTGKGKIERFAILIIVGNGRGLLGLGEGKGPDYQSAMEKAFPQAVRNMDYVERFEDRTVWTEMESKFGATRVIVRPRPVGFGLACNPIIHEVFRIAGIKDASAKVWGSRNQYQVMKAIVRMLLPGREPTLMGNGIGGRGRTMEKGKELRSAMEIERDRGRRIVPLHT